MITIRGKLNEFLSRELCQGNSIAGEPLQDHDGSTSVILKEAVPLARRERAENDFKITFTSTDGLNYIAQEDNNPDKIVFPSGDSWETLGNRLKSKISLGVIVTLISLLSIVCVKFWIFKLSGYLDTQSLTFLKNYTLNNVSLFSAIYIVGLVIIILGAYFVVAILNAVNYSTLRNIGPVCIRNILKMWLVGVWAFSIPGIIFFLAVEFCGVTLSSRYSLLFVIAWFLLTILSCFGNSLPFLRVKRFNSEVSQKPSNINLSIPGAHIAGCLIFTPFLIFFLGFLRSDNSIIEIIEFFIFALLFNTAAHAFNLTTAYKEAKENGHKIIFRIKAFSSFAAFLLFMVIPFTPFFVVSLHKDIIEWSGIGKKEHTFLVTNDLQAALKEAATYPLGENVKSDLHFDSKEKTITAWVVLNVGNRLVLSESEGAKTKYVFSTDPYKLIDIVPGTVKSNS